jgi:hypothetical protein
MNRSSQAADRRRASLKEEFWRPGERRIWVRRQAPWGWGWTINWAEVVRRVRERR